MNDLTRISARTAFALAIVAGTATPLWAQNEPRDPSRSSQRDTNRKDAKKDAADATLPAGVDFRSCHKLKGVDLVNESGENVGEVSDLVLDRGSGRIDYVVIKTGSVLNMAGKSVAIPYASLRWNPGKDQFVLATTKEQLKQYPEFKAERWSEMMEARREGAKPPRDAKDAGDKNPAPRDPSTAQHDRAHDRMLPDYPDNPQASNLYAGRYDTNKKMRVEGEVTSVERIRTGTADEEVIVTVAGNDGSTRRVSIGPSWYVTGGTAAPMRGDRIVAETYQIRDDTGLYTAERVRIGDRDFRVREDNGNPSWASRHVDSSGKQYSSHYAHYVLASNVKGMKVECRGDECGKVNDVIVDRNSGAVALLSIDPNQNFLGIGDTKRLVPWTVANIALGGTVRLDATKEMILGSPETPADLSTLNNGDRAKMVFDAYRVPMPDMEPRKHTAAVPPQVGGAGDAWSASGPIAASVDAASARTLSGKISGVTEVKFDRDITPAKALKIKTAGGDTETVLLGPAWYLNAQGAEYKTGETVTLDVCKAQVDGKTYWISRSVECDGKRVALWENNRPVWDDR